MPINQPVKVAIAEDHQLVRQCVIQSLQQDKDFKVILEAADGYDFLEKMLADDISPDVCLIDINMPRLDGYALVSELKKRRPSIKLLVYSMFFTEYNILRFLKAGVNGIFSKENSLEELKEAIKEIVHHDYYYSPYLPTAINRAYKLKSIVHCNISDREMIFLKFCCSELTYSSIAMEMGVSIKTVDHYRDSLFTKLAVRSRIGLVTFAISAGLVSVPYSQ